MTFSTSAAYAVAVVTAGIAIATSSVVLTCYGYEVDAFSSSIISNKKRQQRQQQQQQKNNKNNKQHDKFQILQSIDFSSSSGTSTLSLRNGRRSLQEFEVTTTTSEFPVLISEVFEEEEEEERLTTIYNSSEVPSGTPTDVVIYGCTTAGLFTALRLLEPDLTQDTIREDVLATSENTDGTLNVVIMEPSDRCGGRLLTAQYDDSFLAELGDMGYYSSSKAYADVLMEYLELDTKTVQSMVMDKNMLYLRGNYLRGNQSPLALSEIYKMNFIERGQSSLDLMIHAVDMLLPGAFDYNETEWYTLFMDASTNNMPQEEKYIINQGSSLSPYLLTKTGFWNALSHVLSNEAIELVSTYFEDTLNIKSNMNALESIVCIVMMVNSYDGPNAGGGMKTPLLGMESIVIELQQRVLDAGGLISLNSMMNELILNNSTNEELDSTANATSSTYDVSFVVSGQGLVELSGVGNVVFATEYDSSNSNMNDALSRVMLTSEFFLEDEEIVEENMNTTTTVVMNGTTDDFEISASRLGHIEPMLTIQNALMSRVPVDYARLYICYDKPWWNTPALGITNGRSVTDLPINTVMYYTDASCLAICSSGTSASYWKHMANGASSKMFLTPTQIEEMMMIDFTVWETRWDELSSTTPQVIIDDAHRQLKQLHNLQYIPSAKSAIFVTNDMVGDSQRMTVPGINPDKLAEYMLRPREEWNVFFIGESYGVGFPYQGLEADLASSENLVQMYFYNQPEPFTFDSTGELTNDELTQTGLAVSSSADGSRIAVVSSSQYDPLKGEVTIYQRIGDEFLGLWKSVGTNFVSDSTVVDLRKKTSTTTGNQTEPIIPEVPIEDDEPEVDEPEVPPVSNETEVGEEIVDEVFIDETDNTTATTNTTNSTRRLLSSYSRVLVERTEMSNMTSVALSGDGRIMAIGVVSAESGTGSVQLWMDASNDASIGNWTKIGSELVSDDNIGSGEFGYSIDLSYDGSILAVGAPSRDQFGAVLVYDCSMLTKANPNDILLQMNSDSSSSSSSSTVAKDIRETFAPATGLLSDFDTSMMNGGSTGSTSSVGSRSRTCVQMGKTMEGIDVVTRYGESVSLSYDGRAVAAGAPNTGSTVPQVGYVSVFSYSQETSDWSQAGNLIAGEETEDQFGFSVSLSADARHLAIGAPGVGTSTTSSGYARVYTFGVTTDLSTNELILDWLPSGSIDGTNTGDNVGFSVALSGDAMRLFVGAPQLDSDADTGGFVFALMQDIANPGNWTLYEETTNGELSGTTLGDSMGYSVASDYEGNNIALGAPQVTTNGQGVVRTFVYVEPPPPSTMDEEEVSVDETTVDPEIIARMIWSDAMLEDRPYPWLEDEPCVQGPELINPNDPNTAMLALADTMSMALIDPRLTEEVEQALIFNMDHNVPMVEEICLPLLDAANIVSIDETLDVQTRVRLDLSITAYEETLVVDLPQVIPPTPAPTEIIFEPPTVGLNVSVGNETSMVGNETDIGLEGIMPPPEGFDENEFEPLPELNETSAENRTTSSSTSSIVVEDMIDGVRASTSDIVIEDIIMQRSDNNNDGGVGGGGGKARHRGEGRRKQRHLLLRRNRRRGLLG